jgi:hypothetical protein
VTKDVVMSWRHITSDSLSLSVENTALYTRNCVCSIKACYLAFILGKNIQLTVCQFVCEAGC